MIEQFERLCLDQKATGFVHSEDLLKHASKKNNGKYAHPENPERTKTIVEYIQNYIKDKNVEQVTELSQCKEEDVLLVHTKEYFDLVQQAFDEVEGGKQQQIIQFMDTYMCIDTPDCALKCVEGVLIGIRNILDGKWQNGFCAVRPPGHHAGHKQRPNGFCIYNNIAIGARYARKHYGLKKILILDWDVHHCDGTEDVFYGDPDTLVISIHRYDENTFYPCSGNPEKVGKEAGKGFNLNIGWNVVEEVVPTEQDYFYAFDRLIGPIAREFKPELILISAGYDSAKGDPLGSIENTEIGYQYYTSELMKIQPKLLAVLEGGYNIKVTAQCALATFQTLLGEPVVQPAYQPNRCGISAVTTATDKIKQYWPILTSPQLIDFERKYLGQAGDFITGGHLQSFEVLGDKLRKFTKKNELEFYSNLNSPENQELIQFIPKLHAVELEAQAVVMENLFYELESASIIDLKMGYKTYNPNGSKIKIEKELEKAQQCKQNEIGFRVAGIKVRDQNNTLIINKNGSAAYTTLYNDELIKEAITQVLCSNGAPLNDKALQDLIKFVVKLSIFIRDSKRYQLQQIRFYRSTSILLIVDNIAKKYAIRWIDFNYVFPLEQDPESPDSKFDENLHGGLTYLTKLLKEIQEIK